MISGAGFNNAEIIGNGTEWGEGRTERRASFAVLLKFELRAHDGSVGLDEGVTLIADNGFRERLAFEFAEVGLRVEKLELGRSSGHKEVDDGFGLRFLERDFWSERASGEVVREQGCCCNFSKADSAFIQKVPSRDRVVIKHGYLVFGDGFVEGEEGAR